MEVNQLKKFIVRELLGEATAEEKLQLEQWLAESDANRRLMEKLTSGVFLRQAVGDRNRLLYEREWKKLEQRTTGRQKRLKRLRWMKIVAVMMLPLLGGIGFWLIRQALQEEQRVETVEQISVGSSRAIVELATGEQILLKNDTMLDLIEQGVHLTNHKDTLNLAGNLLSEKKREGFHVIRIPRGGEYVARLEDGTVIHLNADTELKVPVDFGKTDRKVWLRGEAFFDVARDENRLFTVYTDRAHVSVLGTEFDVRAYPDEGEMVTTLVAGAVELKSRQAAERLEPGEQSRIGSEGEIRTEKVNVYPFIAWKTGRMVFENERLEKIMTELQRWYDFEVFYANPEVKEMCFTIDLLKYREVATVLSLMEKMEKVTFSQQGRAIVVNRR